MCFYINGNGSAVRDEIIMSLKNNKIHYYRENCSPDTIKKSVIITIINYVEFKKFASNKKIAEDTRISFNNFIPIIYLISSQQNELIQNIKKNGSWPVIDTEFCDIFNKLDILNDIEIAEKNIESLTDLIRINKMRRDFRSVMNSNMRKVYNKKGMHI